MLLPAGTTRRILATSALTFAALASGAAAQTAASSLDDALKEAAGRSGREIIYPADAVAGLRAPRVDPRATPEESVRTLLKGTKLHAEFRPDVIIVSQQPPPPSSGDGGPGPEVRTVVVTATRIRGEQPSSPVVVTERRDIEVSGVTDLGEFARRLPQNFGGGQNPGVIGGGNQGGNANATGSSNINLRGLGEDATLTLVNGHRVAYDGLNQGIDISAIPLAAIARIEVVADSASALHGSDAVGGVVNVILRPDYEGLLTTVRVGAALDGGYAQEQFSVVAGSKWSGGGFMVAGDLSRNGSIDARDRDYTSMLDGSTTLFPFRRQTSAVAAASQRFGTITLSLDAQYNRRISETANAFLVTGSARTDGLLVRPTVELYAITPALRAKLGGTWTAGLSATQSQSVSNIVARRFARSVETTQRLRYRGSLQAAEIGAEGPLARLPGGDVRLALGAGGRSVGLTVRNTSTAAGITRTTADYGGSRNVLFAYGELSVPLVGAENGSFLLERLRLDAAARYERYNGLSGILTPKFGIVYEPFAGVALKGTWGRAFKAPTLQQEKQIRQSALLPASLFVGGQANRTVLLLAGGGASLRPERAETWSGTIELRPSAELKLSARYFDVRYRDRVASPITSVVSALNDPRFADLIVYSPTVAQLDAAIATLPQGLSNQTGQPYEPASVSAIIDNGLQNVAQQTVRGLDLTLDYRATMSNGQRLGVIAFVSRLDSDQRLSAGQSPIQRAGTIFDPPHWRGRVGATWEHRGLTAGTFATYNGENRDDRFSPQSSVGSFVTVDASFRARSRTARGPLTGAEVGVNVLNLLGEEPSRIRNLNRADPPYDSTNSSVVGRAISVTLSKAW